MPADTDPIPDTRSDQALLSRARRGDRSAGVELWRRHSSYGLTVADGLAPDEDFQAMNTRAWVHILDSSNDEDAADGFRPYLYLVLRAISSVEEKLDNGFLDDAYFSLSTADREVLWYSHIEGMKPPQIATVLGLAPMDVPGMLHEARQHLRSQWALLHAEATNPGTICRRIWLASAADGADMDSIDDTDRVNNHLRVCRTCKSARSDLITVASHLRDFVLPRFASRAGATNLIGYVHTNGGCVRAATDLPTPVDDLFASSRLYRPLPPPPAPAPLPAPQPRLEVVTVPGALSDTMAGIAPRSYDVTPVPPAPYRRSAHEEPSRVPRMAEPARAYDTPTTPDAYLDPAEAFDLGPNPHRRLAASVTIGLAAIVVMGVAALVLTHLPAHPTSSPTTPTHQVTGTAAPSTSPDSVTQITSVDTGPLNNLFPVVTGIAPPHAGVTVQIGDTEVVTVSSDEGVWTTQGLAMDISQIRGAVTASIGAGSEPAVVVYEIAEPPTTTVTLDPTHVTVVTTGIPDAHVDILVDGAATATSTLDPTGASSTPMTLPSGTHFIQVRYSDADRVGPISAVQPVVIP
ncbi:MAG: hypothetical protein FWD75_04370 [Propionibacteriaceae bacterium]|nr:hypothetical protein [Propionibacteriaceae bacterium]